MGFILGELEMGGGLYQTCMMKLHDKCKGRCLKTSIPAHKILTARNSQRVNSSLPYQAVCTIMHTG